VLVQLAQSGSEEAKASATGALWNLAISIDNRVAISIAQGRMRVGSQAGLMFRQGVMQGVAESGSGEAKVIKTDMPHLMRGQMPDGGMQPESDTFWSTRTKHTGNIDH
jgi:hypothetical protein